MQRVTMVHEDPVKLVLAAEMMRKYPERWDDPNGMAGVIREGRSLFIAEVPDALIATAARDAEHLRLLRALQFSSIIVVPITARGRVLGALTLCMTESARQYTAADLALAEDLGRRAGITIDTVRLLRDAQDARAAAETAADRTARLQHVTALLSEAMTAREVADTVVAEGIPALGADSGVVYLVSDDGLRLDPHIAPFAGWSYDDNITGAKTCTSRNPAPEMKKIFCVRGPLFSRASFSAKK